MLLRLQLGQEETHSHQQEEGFRMSSAQAPFETEEPTEAKTGVSNSVSGQAVLRIQGSGLPDKGWIVRPVQLGNCPTCSRRAWLLPPQPGWSGQPHSPGWSPGPGLRPAFLPQGQALLHSHCSQASRKTLHEQCFLRFFKMTK